MTPDKSQDHQTRKLVLNYVRVHPGASFVSIQKVFDLTEGTLRYHLSSLEKSERLHSKLVGRNRCYYPVGAPSTPELFPDADPSTLTGRQGRILTIIKGNGGITMEGLADRTGLDRRVLQYNVKVLRDRMMVWKLGNGRNTKYEYVSDERLREELLRLLITKYLDREIDGETYRALRVQLRRGEG